MEKNTVAVTGQFGDTTYTKVFVGGLAWETQKDAVEKYFERFGEILEAVVINDKSTGRSKGYGFVTFREAKAAMKACVEPTPVIDGRKANCNLASLGVQRSKLPSSHNNGGRNGKVVNQVSAAAFSSVATAFPSYAIPQGIGIPCTQIYGYSPYSADYAYPTGYYGVYGGGAAARYPLYGTGNGVVPSALYYSYMNMSNRPHPEGAMASYYAGHGYGVPYHHHLHHLIQYSATTSVPVCPPHYGTPMSRPPSNPIQSGMKTSHHLRAPPIPHP